MRTRAEMKAELREIVNVDVKDDGARILLHRMINAYEATDEHCVFRGDSRSLVCLHCETGSYVVNLPIPIDMFVALGLAFGKAHQHCPKPVERTVRPELVLPDE